MSSSASIDRPGPTGPPEKLSAEDELEIGALVARYADAVIAGDAAQWESTWATEARWIIGSRTVLGRPTIVELWKELIAMNDWIVQLVSNGVVRRTPDGVVGRWLLLEIIRRVNGEHDLLQVACYVDRYVHEDGMWRFAERNLTVPYRGQIAAGTFIPVLPFPFGSDDGPSSK